MNPAARKIVTALALEPLPGEGGFFRQTSRTATASAIYFLLTPEDFSALHRLGQDEVWHFYAGDCLEHVQLDPGVGSMQVTLIGPDVLSGEQPQLRVPAGVWQGARLISHRRGGESHGWTLVGCTVSPPWDERRFELASREGLLAAFPAHRTVIESLTR